ncbi:hypothetical protein F511_41458 [Dorcoceras hygrometricum]|uniref:Uncharacterized protein n=1 Tax=Dorcoceras hygrometricum TaxID=472368 RepID=A0A2Z7ACN6_9LAMI|nr:hypothetical protein F511_41458 [Dorcoceras hygrometricum]
MDVTITPMETLLKRFQSFKPPTLKGMENSDDCGNCLEDIEQLCDSLDYSDDRRIRLVVHQLHEVAKIWWITMKKALEHRVLLVEPLGSLAFLVQVSPRRSRWDVEFEPVAAC